MIVAEKQPLVGAEGLLGRRGGRSEAVPWHPGSMLRPRRLLLGLLALTGFVAPMDSIRAGGIGGLADVMLLASLGLLAFIVLATGNYRKLTSYGPVLLAATGMAFAGLIGTFFSVSPASSALNIARFTIAVCGMMIVFANAAENDRDVRLLMWSYVMGSSASALYGLVRPSPSGRPQGLSFHPNALGLTSVFALCLLCGLISVASLRVRVIGLALVAILGLGIVISGSRAALVAGAVGTLVFVVASRNQRLIRYGALAVVSAILALFLGLYALPETTAIDRLFTPSELTSQIDQERALVRDVAIQEIDAHPLTGSGFGNATAAHNLPLQALQAGGILGLAAFLFLVASILRPLIRRRRDRLVAGVLAMYCGYLATFFASNALWDRWLWFPIICGLALHATRSARATVGGGSRTQLSHPRRSSLTPI